MIKIANSYFSQTDVQSITIISATAVSITFRNGAGLTVADAPAEEVEQVRAVQEVYVALQQKQIETDRMEVETRGWQAQIDRAKAKLDREEVEERRKRRDEAKQQAEGRPGV